jgi:hypothetical protein
MTGFLVLTGIGKSFVTTTPLRGARIVTRNTSRPLVFELYDVYVIGICVVIALLMTVN